MPCFQSVLARRLLLWYILLGSIIILPLSWDVTTGCNILVVKTKDADSNETSMGFGLFSHAVYDEADGSFLSCVKYSQYWGEQTNDPAFKAGRAFGGLMVAFVTLATLICILVQCFNKHGKTCLWGWMKWSYAVAFISQGAIFSLWASDVCSVLDGKDSTCKIGPNSVGAGLNFLLLLGMVIATFNSLPPRNPVFRLWNIIPTEYETDKVDTDDDHSDDIEAARNLKSMIDDVESEDDRMESVSLFGSTRSAARSITSRGSSRRRSRRQRSSFDEQSEEVTRTRTTTSKEDPPSVSGSVSVNDPKTQSDSSKKSLKSSKTSKTMKTESSSRMGSTKREPSIAEERSIEVISMSGNSTIASSKKDPSTSGSKRNQSTGLRRSSKESGKDMSSQAGTAKTSDEASQVSGRSGGDRSESGSSVTLARLRASTVVGVGGTRLSETRIGKKLELVDEYPAESISGKSSKTNDNDGTDIVKVRTEYFPEGRKTIKEVTHTDGSRTVTTLIDPTPIES